MEAPEANPRRNRIGWIAISAVLVALLVGMKVEPMRWSLPSRYLLKPLDIHRTGFTDFTMCMRVELSPAEAREFVEDHFEPKHRIARAVAMEEPHCPADFRRTSVGARTLGYSRQRRDDGSIEGTSGAIYENGYLYFWANTS